MILHVFHFLGCFLMIIIYILSCTSLYPLFIFHRHVYLYVNDIMLYNSNLAREYFILHKKHI